MGTWSVALYGSDVANDIRDDVKELLRTPLDEDGITGKLALAYPDLENKAGEDYPDMWLVLADQFHAHGLKAERIFATANAIIDSGLDLETKRACGMIGRDLKKRAKVLAELRAKWARPHAKPIKRKVQEKPGAFVFEPGDCIVYPVKETGRTLNPIFAKPENDPDWKHGGYGAATVLARGHYLGIFAWYAVARLSLLGPGKPTLDDCANAAIDCQTTILEQRMGEKPALCIGASRLTPGHARKMGIETIGRLAPDAEAINEDLAAIFEAGFTPGTNLCNELSGFGIRAPSRIKISRYAKPPPGREI